MQKINIKGRHTTSEYRKHGLLSLLRIRQHEASLIFIKNFDHTLCQFSEIRPVDIEHGQQNRIAVQFLAYFRPNYPRSERLMLYNKMAFAYPHCCDVENKRRPPGETSPRRRLDARKLSTIGRSTFKSRYIYLLFRVRSPRKRA